jgi:glyoxylase-like metal-dependent hydrolase (beta-lactamase superfamily II)
MIHRFSVGGLSCAVLSDGQPEPPLEPELSEFFTPESGVPVDALRAAVDAESPGRTTLTCGYNCLVVETPDGPVIVDTGLGARFFGYGPYLEPLVGRLGNGLSEAGYTPDELAAVVFTHLHQDHARGAVWPGELAFPNAFAFAHAAEVAFWSSPESSESSGAAPHLEAARTAIRLFGERLRTFDADAEILPGLRTVAAAGHTPGHTAYLLESHGELLLCVGDLFYDRLQLSHPAWRTPWDLDAAASVRSRRRLLAWAANERLLVHAYHLPFPGLGTIEHRGDAFEWKPQSA